MSMIKITMDEVKRIGDKFGVKPIRVKGTNVVQIAKNASSRFDVIGWDDFENSIKKRGLAVYKSEKGNFLKIMKDRK